MTGTRHPEPATTTGPGTRRSSTASGTLSSFVRFALIGGTTGIAAGAAVTELAGAMPWAVANALVTVASTVLCTELHAFLTFRTGRPAGRRGHLRSAGSAAAAYAATSGAVAVLELLRPTAGVLAQQAVYLAAAGLAGLGRFLVLRLYVFGDGQPVRPPGPHTAQPAPGSLALAPS